MELGGGTTSQVFSVTKGFLFFVFFKKIRSIQVFYWSKNTLQRCFVIDLAREKIREKNYSGKRSLQAFEGEKRREEKQQNKPAVLAHLSHAARSNRVDVMLVRLGKNIIY